MININVFSEEKAWSKRLKNKDIFFKKICKAFPKKYKFLNKKVTFTLLLSNNKNIKNLNKVFRKKNKSTDILSFPLNKNLKISIYDENNTNMLSNTNNNIVTNNNHFHLTSQLHKDTNTLSPVNNDTPAGIIYSQNCDNFQKRKNA